MSLIAFLFYAFATLAVVAALLVLFSRKVLYSAFALLLSLLGVAAIYVLLAADFLAISQIVIYVGGVLVLLIFAVMYTQKSHDTLQRSPLRNRLVGLCLGLIFLGGIVVLIVQSNIDDLPWLQQSIQTSTVQPIGILLMTHYVLVFELTAVLLLAALIASTYLAGKGEK